MIKDFCLHETTKKQFWQILKELLATDKRWRIAITEWRDRRSLSQNSLMWKWNDEIAKQVNKLEKQHFSNNDIHEYLKKLYCPVTHIAIFGVTREACSTKLLDAGEMHFYLSKVEVWAYSHGLKLTIPESCEYRQLQQKQVEQ